MADKFRVGQKVRIVQAPNYPDLLGTVCIIKTPQRIFSAPDGPFYGYQLDIIRDGSILNAFEHQIEPLYDGDEVSSWSACEWKPKPEVIDNKLPEVWREKL